MADKVDGENIEKTIADLQEANKHNEKLVSKINVKMCTRPPFRFLHDNITTMMAQHKYHPDLFEGAELNAKEIDRQGKLDFFDKIIGVVAGDFPQVGELGLKAGKVCAGKECEKTRAFLQYLCLAATGGAAGAAAPAEKEEAKQEAKEEAKQEPKDEPKQEEAAPAEAKTEESAPASGSDSTSFGFTINDVDQSDGNLPKTMEMLSFLEKPKPSERHLKRPPFRFLHDLIIGILNSKSYHADLYEGPELKAKEMDKPAKIAFLAKIKDTVSADIGVDIDIAPPKVCAGKDCEKTRTFLQYLALAAHGVKGGGETASAPAAKPKPKEPQPKPAAEPKNETKTSDPEPDASSGPSESKTSGGGGDMNVDNGSVEKTAEMISAIISKPVMKPRLLQRPPFRFLHDVTFNIMKETGFGIDKFNDEEKDAKAMPKPSRTTVLQKIFDLTANALGIEIKLAPSKVTAGKECEQTRQFLQYFCIAATGGKLSANSASPAPAPTPTPKKSRRSEEPKRREPEPVPVESKTDSVQLPDKPRAESRPTTAKRAPPKLANAAQKKDLKKQFVLEDVGTDGVIMDGESEEESSDDNDVEEEHARHRSKQDKKDKNRKRGKLISKIESELETNAKKKKETWKRKQRKRRKEGH